MNENGTSPKLDKLAEAAVNIDDSVDNNLNIKNGDYLSDS